MTTRTITVEDVKRAIRIVADAEQYDLGYVKEVKRLADDVADTLAALPAEPAGATGHPATCFCFDHTDSAADAGLREALERIDLQLDANQKVIDRIATKIAARAALAATPVGEEE